MSVYKDTKNNTWKVYYRFTDWQGKVHQSTKRGFPTKREALAWEREQLHKVEADLDMTFESFIDTYTADMKNRLKENTWHTKEHIIRTKLLPYVQLSGLTKQDYITRRLTHKDVVVQGNPRVFKALRNQLAEVLAELQRIETGSAANDELLGLIEMIADILGGMKEESE